MASDADEFRTAVEEVPAQFRVAHERGASTCCSLCFRIHWLERPCQVWILIPSCGVLAQFSGHAVVPSLYRDMAQPATFNSMIDVAYIFTFVVTMLFAALGYLMFGNGVSSEITRDLAKTPGYPVALNKLAVWMVAVSRVVLSSSVVFSVAPESGECLQRIG